MKLLIKLLLLSFFLGFQQCKPQNLTVYNELGLTAKLNYEKHGLDISKRGNAFQFMHLRRYLGANNALLVKGYNTQKVITYQWQLIDNLVASARISKQIPNNRNKFADNYEGWISQSQTEMINQEVMLYEGYSFFYIAQFLYITKQSGWSDANKDNNKKWNNLLAFIEKNIWQKWMERSKRMEGDPYYLFLGRRTHMGSHWAGIAMYLNKVSNNSEVIKTTSVLLHKYNNLLKRNMRVKSYGYVWNSTYDDTTGIDVFKSNGDIIQDISHGNHVVSYIVASYEIGSKSWSLEDLKRISYSLKTFAYDKTNKRFRSNIDGSTDKNVKNENFVGDGWVKLAKYDNELKLIFEEFSKSEYVKGNLQELQFEASILNLR